MKCPECGYEIQEGKLLCEKCGAEIHIVPDFEPEIENSILESLSGLVEDITPQPKKKQSQQQGKESQSTSAKKAGTKEPSMQKQQKRKMEESVEEIFNESLMRPHLFEFLFQKQAKRAVICLSIIILLIFVGVGALISSSIKRNNSYDYQKNMALERASLGRYEEAIEYMVRAIELGESPEKKSVDSLTLAEYYMSCKRNDEAIILLESLIHADTETVEEAYAKLIIIYEKQKDYEDINRLLENCENETVLARFQQYIASEPIFSMASGVYDKVMPLKITANAAGKIYYTLDGSTPSTSSYQYTAPIMLESGKYEIQAIFINELGIESEVVSANYVLDVVMPQDPAVNLNSGNFTAPSLIQVDKQLNCTIYYTTDGSVPTVDSTRYTNPFPMPLGKSTFKFVCYSDNDIYSDIVEREYTLNLDAVVSTDSVDSIAKQGLFVRGLIADIEGHPIGSGGQFFYQTNSAITFQRKAYYLVVEYHDDGTQVKRKTGNLFAIDVNSGELYKTAVDDFGGYTVVPF